MKDKPYDKHYKELYQKEKAKKSFSVKLEHEMNVRYLIK
jgi:hypothetical protein